MGTRLWGISTQHIGIYIILSRIVKPHALFTDVYVWTNQILHTMQYDAMNLRAGHTPLFRIEKNKDEATPYVLDSGCFNQWAD